MTQRLAVLVSGTGSNLKAMIEEGLPIVLVLADRDCRGLGIAREAGISTELLKRYCFRKGKTLDRRAYTQAVVAMLKRYHIDRVAMAGFMTVFSEEMFADGAYSGRILNLHPALLPAFKGGRAVADALTFGVKITGCTIHIATIELDTGPIIAQEAVRVEPGDTVETLHERIKQVERKLYPATIRCWIADESI